jgi:hypothetical protein
MYTSLPTDIARQISILAIQKRHEDIQNQIRMSLMNILDCAVTEKCETNIIPLFKNSTKTLYVTRFSQDMTYFPSMKNLMMTFRVHQDEFELTKNTYAVYGGEEHEYALFVVNKHGRYADIVSELFGHMFVNSIIY